MLTDAKSSGLNQLPVNSPGPLQRSGQTVTVNDVPRTRNHQTQRCVLSGGLRSPHLRRTLVWNCKS